MNRGTEGHVLLVGEGNFSLSASLVANETLSGAQVVTSCLSSQASVQEAHEHAQENIEYLAKSGATVLFEVDARELHNHEVIRFFEFSRVIFNFPLADRHNIKKNRALLSDFFSSAVHILDPHKGQVMVTLCKGQGGTPADEPLRSWHNSWQIVSMAANAGFILTEICPFSQEQFGGYKSVGFRFQDKGFNTNSALTHIFERAKVVTPDDFGVKERCYFAQGHQQFVVPSYIRDKLDRWRLLEQPHHPMATLHKYLSRSLQMLCTVFILQRDSSKLPEVLEGCRSSLSIIDPGAMENVRMHGCLHDEDVTSKKLERIISDKSKSSKDMKNMQNLVFAASSGLEDSCADTAQCVFFNTVVTEEGEGQVEIKSEDVTKRVFAHGVSQDTVSGKPTSQQNPAGNFYEYSTDVTATKLKTLSSPVFVVWKAANSQTSSTSLGCEKDTAFESPAVLQGAQIQSTDYTLFHLRCSLLENLPHVAALAENNSKPCKTFLVTGSVFNKCAISSLSLPVSHEMLFISFTNDLRADDLINHFRATLKEFVKEDIVIVQQAECQVRVSSKGLLSDWLILQTSKTSTVLGHVFKYQQSQNSDSSTGKEQESKLLQTSSITSLQGVGILLYLEQIILAATKMPDVRLLWSEDHRLLSQFHDEPSDIVTMNNFNPFSLYPVRFVHDVSFWENPERIFDEEDFLDIIRDTAGDIVTSVTLLDKFNNSENGKTSRCYRLVFQVHDQALSYITSWKLQCRIRIEIAQKLGVELR